MPDNSEPTHQDGQPASAAPSAVQARLDAIQGQVRILAALTSQEIIQLRVALQVVQDLQRAILSKMGFSVLEIDQMCAHSRGGAETVLQEEMSARLKSLLAP
jgi:hypothetical protein